MTLNYQFCCNSNNNSNSNNKWVLQTVKKMHNPCRPSCWKRDLNSLLWLLLLMLLLLVDTILLLFLLQLTFDLQKICSIVELFKYKGTLTHPIFPIQFSHAFSVLYFISIWKSKLLLKLNCEESGTKCGFSKHKILKVKN